MKEISNAQVLAVESWSIAARGPDLGEGARSEDKMGARPDGRRGIQAGDPAAPSPLAGHGIGSGRPRLQVPQRDGAEAVLRQHPVPDLPDRQQLGILGGPT